MELEELEKKPLYEIGIEMARLEQEINLKITMYNRLIREVNRRFPLEITKETFIEKELKDGKDKRKKLEII